MPPKILMAIWGMVTGGLYALALTNDVEGFPWGVVAWIALIPLHLTLEQATPRQAFCRGWGTGLLCFAGTIYWVITAMHQYGQVPFLVSFLLMILLASYLALYVGLYAVGVVVLRTRWPLLVVIGAPALWVTLEWVRTFFLSGLPWGLLGYSQFRFLPIIQIADLTGVYGVSFLLVQANITVYLVGHWMWKRRYQKSISPPWPVILGTFLTILLVGGYGIQKLQKETELARQEPAIHIGLVQANIDQSHKWDAAYRMETMKRYSRLTTQAAPGTDLIIWPEAATPFLYEQEPHYQAMIRSLLNQTKTPLVFGSPVLQRHPDGRPFLFNSAYLLHWSGNILGRYDKQHLVPFGEYIPLRWLLFFLDKLVVGIGDFEVGAGPTLLTLPASSTKSSLQFGVAICFEVIFPNLVREFAASGANFLVTITNDAWFGDTVAPFQHFAMVVFRAVENRMAFARAANTGISGFIAPNGKILEATPLFTERFVRGTIPLTTGGSFYTRFGDVFSWTCIFLSLFLLWFPRSSSSESRN